MLSAHLPLARERYPDLAKDEAAAEARFRDCFYRADIHGAAKALADWIDSQTLLLVLLYCDDEHLGHA